MNETPPLPAEEEGEHLDVMVPALMAGMRVDRALSMLTSCSRSEAVAVIESGVVLLDGTVVTAEASDHLPVVATLALR